MEESTVQRQRAHIKELAHRAEILDYTDMLYSVPLPSAGLTHEDILGKVLTGEYEAVKTIYDDRVVGIAVFQLVGTVCFVYLVYCPGYFRLFERRFGFIATLRGATEIRAITAHPTKSFARTTGYEYLFSCFRRTL